MIDKKITSLAAQVAELKMKSQRPRYPQELLDQVSELRAYLTTSDLAQRIGIDLSTIRRRTKAPPKNVRRQHSSVKLQKHSNKNASPSIPKLALLPSPSLALSSPTKAPVLEMELPSGVKIRIYS